jgi:hypothetical protein
VDLVGFRAIKWRDETLGAEFDIVDVPPEMLEEAKAFRTKLVETAVEQDDAALEAYLGGEEPSEQVLKRCIRKGTIGVVPGAGGSAKNGVSSRCSTRSRLPSSADRRGRDQRHQSRLEEPVRAATRTTSLRRAASRS